MKRVLTASFMLVVGYYYLGVFASFIYDVSERPFVYRQLVPTLVYPMNALGMSYSTAVKIVIMVFIILMVESLRSLYTSLLPDTIATEAYIIMTSLIVFLLAIYPPHTYDIPTVALFTLSLALMQRDRLVAFMCLFPVVCLNRETAFLLIIIMFIFYFDTLDMPVLISMTIALGVTYILIQLGVRLVFASYSGYHVSNYFVRNLIYLVYNPYVGITTVLLSLLTLAMTRARWSYLPKILRVSVIVTTPILLVSYLVIGTMTELRVFLEVLPVITLIGVYDNRWTNIIASL